MNFFSHLLIGLLAVTLFLLGLYAIAAALFFVIGAIFRER